MVIKGYRRPGDLAAAAALLREQGTALLGGGSRLLPQVPAGLDTLIDLAGLDLAGVDNVGLDPAAADMAGSDPAVVGLVGADLTGDDPHAADLASAGGDMLAVNPPRMGKRNGAARLGAMLRLSDALEMDAWDGLLREAILRAAPSLNLRNQMTIGGETAWRSPDAEIQEMQVALLALDAMVLRHEMPPTPLTEYLAESPRPGIITGISLPRPSGWRHRFQTVEAARGARPELALACAILAKDGKLRECRLALGLPGLVAVRLHAMEKAMLGAVVKDVNAKSLIKALPDQGQREAPWREWTASLVARFLSDLSGEVADAG